MLSNPEVVFSGVVTRDKWINWFKLHSNLSLPDRDGKGTRIADSLLEVIEYRAIRIFDVLSESEFLLENFFKLPKAVQLAVCDFARDNDPIRHVELFAMLSLQLQSKDSSFDFRDVKAWRIDDYLRRKMGVISSDFDDLLFEYQGFYEHDTLSLNHGVVLMLAIIHGEALVEKILKRWTRGACPGSACDFVMVVECAASGDWEMFDQYPIEWVVSVLQGESADFS